MIAGSSLFIRLGSLKLLVVVAAAALAALTAEAAFPGPNHRKGLIVFQGNSKIFTIDPNVSNPNSTIRQLTTNGYNPAWSPDGRRIAFSTTRDGRDREIYVMNADGTNPVRLTYNPGLDDDPAWSPDGRR